jgi:hypothetical protein
MIYYETIDIRAKQRDSFWFFDNISNLGWTFTWLPRALVLGHERMIKPPWAKVPATNKQLHELIRVVWKAQSIGT